jgi:hypothetical protein
MKLFLNILTTIAVIALAVWLFMIIREPIVLKQQNKIKKNEIVKRLELIRLAQFTYKDLYGKFTDNWDSLIFMCKSQNMRIIKTIGDPNDTTIVVKRDTLFLPVKDTLFPVNYYIDSLRFIPFAGGAIFDLQAGTIEQRGVKVHVFQVSDSKPFDPDHPLIMGSMSEVNYSGNWK